MSSLLENVGTGPATKEAQLAAGSHSSFDSGLLRVCCGHLIAPQLAEVRHPEGPTIFVAVWHCPQCNHLTFK